MQYRNNIIVNINQHRILNGGLRNHRVRNGGSLSRKVSDKIRGSVCHICQYIIYIEK